MWLKLQHLQQNRSQFGAKTRYTQSGQELSTGVKEKFSLDEDTNINIDDIKILRSINQKSVNAFNSEDIKKSEKWARKFYKEIGIKSPFFRAWFGDWRAYDSTKIWTKTTAIGL